MLDFFFSACFRQCCCLEVDTRHHISESKPRQPGAVKGLELFYPGIDCDVLATEGQWWRELMFSHPSLLRVRDIWLCIAFSSLENTLLSASIWARRKLAFIERDFSPCTRLAAAWFFPRAEYHYGWEKKDNPLTAPAGKGKSRWKTRWEPDTWKASKRVSGYAHRLKHKQDSFCFKSRGFVQHLLK